MIFRDRQFEVTLYSKGTMNNVYVEGLVVKISKVKSTPGSEEEGSTKTTSPLPTMVGGSLWDDIF